MSDYASTYASTAEELTDLLSLDKIITMMGQEDIVQNFIPKKAP